MNILYINHYAGSVYHGMEYRPYYLAREWVRAGHKVTIIASSYSHLRNYNIEIEDGSEYLEETIDGINYIWCKTAPYTRNGVRRLINIFQFLKRLKRLKKLIINNIKPELVIASSTYPFDTKIAHTLACKLKAKMVYEVHDLWPLTLIEVGGMKKWHPFILYMQLSENYGYKYADKVVSLLPFAKEYMIKHGMKQDKFVFIPNGIAIDDINTAAAITTEPIHNSSGKLKSYSKKEPRYKVDFFFLHYQVLYKLKSQGKFLIGYAGSIGKANSLTDLISSAKLLMLKRLYLKNPIEIVLIIVGNGPELDLLKNKVKQYRIDNVIFLPPLSKAQIHNFYAMCDALYLGWKKLPIYRFGTSPNKIFDYMLSKKPIIQSISYSNDIVAEAKCGLTVPAEEPEAISEAMLELSKMPQVDLQRLGENGCNYVTANHDYKKLASLFLEKVFLIP